VLAERGEVGLVGDHLHGEVPVHLEPLRALAPPRHADVVAVREQRVVPRRGHEAVHEAGGGAREDGVDGRQVVERDARLGEQSEALVPEVQQRVRQEPALRLQQAHASPHRFLHPHTVTQIYSCTYM
jgi:hypothetical protein